MVFMQTSRQNLTQKMMLPLSFMVQIGKHLHKMTLGNWSIIATQIGKYAMEYQEGDLLVQMEIQYSFLQQDLYIGIMSTRMSLDIT